MTKLSKRVADAAEPREKDYVIWDDELPGFGLRVFASGKRSYLIQYRSAGRSRRYTIGQHGVWTPELARKEAKIQLGRVAQGDNPAEERQLDHNAITVKELCDLYFTDLKAGLILGKGGRAKKASTIVTDTGRINRHIVPLIGTRRVKDLVKADINKVLKDIMAGKTRASVKTKKLRGKAIVRGGAGTATRTVGLLGGILSYAVDAGIIETNPARGIRKPKDRVRSRRLTEAEYRILGGILRKAAEDESYQITTDIIRQIALTGCRRSEMIKLRWIETDMEASCLRLADSKEGASTRAIGLPVVEFLEGRWAAKVGTYVFAGQGDDNAFGSFPNHWEKIFRDTSLADITPHVLRHSFASIANDLGFTEITIAALIGHAKGSVTSKYIHTIDTALIMAADTISGYIQGLLDGVEFKQTAYALDRDSRKTALARFLCKAVNDASANAVHEQHLAA
ncbi:integrase arm-type DNA-binding domain-containing protein [Bradyrhizobium sp. Leo121]|uniref:tyrosine-type recombinase/integrase n=1 Tax=Bradyrhizobium sp. Leo121 TaxID=1571195 RepID=UPI0010293C3D|nr:integrase arm-type DNA-binding domain-containing protein [Bradyrhizobium sp. Leo121]RZN13419.1 integrase [Bradyrhizobium sp. Leo121]